MRDKEFGEKNLDKTEASSCECQGNTWVYIWKMTAKKVGHTAIQVGGCKPKFDETDNNGEYISIHPNMVPSIGPTVIFPLPAGLASTLSEDMTAEAGSQNNAMLGELTGIMEPFPPQHIPSSCLPDYTFNIPHLKTNDMRKLITLTRDEVKTGATTYQLLPKINTLGFFKDIPEYINYNPVDIAKKPKQSPTSGYYGYNRYNCVTLVSTILATGGMPIQQSNMPWGQTPNDLIEQLSKNTRVC